MKILRGVASKKTPERGALKKWRGGSKNLYTSKPTGGGGGLLKIEPLAMGAAKISSFQFQYLHTSPPPPPPTCHIK